MCSGLEVLVDRRHVQHHVLPIGPLGSHHLVNVLTEKGEAWLESLAPPSPSQPQGSRAGQGLEGLLVYAHHTLRALDACATSTKGPRCGCPQASPFMRSERFLTGRSPAGRGAGEGGSGGAHQGGLDADTLRRLEGQGEVPSLQKRPCEGAAPHVRGGSRASTRHQSTHRRVLRTPHRPGPNTCTFFTTEKVAPSPLALSHQSPKSWTEVRSPC